MTSSPTSNGPSDGSATGDAAPDFGPGGYLPQRAAKRARKIVLRAPLGLQWLVAAIVFGVVVVVAGAVFLRSGGPPGPPYVIVLDAIPVGEPAVLVDDPDLLVVFDAGPVLAFPDAASLGLGYCPAAREIRAEDGRRWTASGRGLGTASLDRLPVIVRDGAVYADPTARLAGPAPADAAPADAAPDAAGCD